MDPSTLEAVLMLRYNRDLWDIFSVDRLVLKNESYGDAVVDNSDDEELDLPDGEMDDERDKFEDEVEFAQRLSAHPLPFNHGGHVR